METNTIVYLIIGFLVLITVIRRQMLKPVPKKADRREGSRRTKIRRKHMGRRQHESNEACKEKDRRKEDDRRRGKKERRYKERRRDNES